MRFPLSCRVCPSAGMSHEPKSPSLGMISTATRTTATVSPLTPSPLNGSIVANGSPASQSAHSGFAAALRKLAKQAEEPRGKPHLMVQSEQFKSSARLAALPETFLIDVNGERRDVSARDQDSLFQGFTVRLVAVKFPSDYFFFSWGRATVKLHSNNANG